MKDGTLKRKHMDATIKILKAEHGFQIEYSYKFGVMILDLKYLNTNKLILTENDRELEFYKVL